MPEIPPPPSRLGKYFFLTSPSIGPSGTAFASSVRDWRNTSRRRSRRARTCSLRAALSARRTNAKLAKARKPRPPSRPFGAFAPMSCASLIAVDPSRKQSFLVLMLRAKSLKHPMALPFRPGVHWPSDFHRRAFFSVRRGLPITVSIIFASEITPIVAIYLNGVICLSRTFHQWRTIR